jgi:hypothetical protein
MIFEYCERDNLSVMMDNFVNGLEEKYVVFFANRLV